MLIRPREERAPDTTAVPQNRYQRAVVSSRPGALFRRGVSPQHQQKNSRRLYDAHNISPQLHREITGMRYTDPEVDRLIGEEEQKTVALIHSLLTSLRPLPEVKDLEAAAHLIHRAAEEVIHSIKILCSPIEAERLLAELNTMLTGYLFGKNPDS